VAGPGDVLSDEQRARLARGAHEAVAAELAGAGERAAAGWVLEQIWDFVAAAAHYAAADRPLDALRCALEAARPDLLDHALAALERADPPARKAAVAALQKRGRHSEAARLLAADDADPAVRAAALVRAGDRLAAAQVLAAAGRAREGLDALMPLPEAHAPTLAFAARLAWDLGDAEGCVRHAQAAMRALEREAPQREASEPRAAPKAIAGPPRREPSGPRARPRAALSPGTDAPPRPREIQGTIEEPPAPRPAGEGLRAEVARTLARGLAALGHPLAAALVLQAAGAADDRGGALPGRYRVQRALPASYAGAAYEGVDRVTQREVEVHLLLAEVQDTGLESAGVQAALAAFARRAEAAQALAHPAVRPLLRFDPAAGLLILPHAEGPPLRALIRPPGMPWPRARALAAFLLDGLAAAHARGIVHGSLLPAQIVCDAAGRPLLGPFGADEIAGLVATRTGALEELLTVTPPELRAGGRPTPASDVYGAAALLVALRLGSLAAGPDRLPAAERALVDDALDPDPARRPDAAALLARLRVRVADPRELADAAPDPKHMSEGPGRELAADAGALVVDAAPGWSEAELDAVLAADAPRLQSVLDRAGRRVVLAAWPEGCARLADAADDGPLRGLLAELPAAARTAVAGRLRPSAWVRTAAGEWMLALDDLLAR
jgi:hypothetical protein